MLNQIASLLTSASTHLSNIQADVQLVTNASKALVAALENPDNSDVQAAKQAVANAVQMFDEKWTKVGIPIPAQIPPPVSNTNVAPGSEQSGQQAIQPPGSILGGTAEQVSETVAT